MPVWLRMTPGRWEVGVRQVVVTGGARKYGSGKLTLTGNMATHFYHTKENFIFQKLSEVG